MRNQLTRTESISCSAWKDPEAPRSVLIIRMHAIGDVAISLPAVCSFTRYFPNTRIDYITTTECSPLVEAVDMPGRVIPFPARLTRSHRMAMGAAFGWQLRRKRYDVVLDLQRNWLSRLIRRIAAPRAWNEFDRFGRRAASHRVLECFHSAGFAEVSDQEQLFIKKSILTQARELLLAAGWNGTSKLLVLNPAGLWKTRQWPIDNYVQVARLLQPGNLQFLLMGTERIRDKSRYIVQQLGQDSLDLVKRTTLAEALAVLRFCNGIVTEDSGLMHMAWATGTPTVALFGSTDHIWSAPTGKHVRCFHSGDLQCGACMQEECKHGDVRCLARVTPEMVVESFRQLTVNI